MSQHEYFIFEINDHTRTQLNVLFLLDINEKTSKSLFAVIKNNVAMVLYITERWYKNKIRLVCNFTRDTF